MKLEKIKTRGSEKLYRDRDTGIIYFREFRKEWGGELKLSTHTKDEKIARQFRNEIYARDKRKLAQLKQRKTALELFDLWRERKTILGKSEGTLTSINSSRKYLKPFLEVMMPDEITAVWWEAEYIPQVRAKTENQERKFFNDRKWLLSFLKQLHDDGLISVLPKLLNPDPPVDSGRIISDEAIEDLLNMAQNDDLRLAILMASTMGMRRLEIFNLACDRVDLAAGVIKLRREDCKTRKARSFAISPACLPELTKRCANGAKWVFPSKTDPSRPVHRDGFKTAWTNLRDTVGIKCKFHWLRHTFLTKAFKAPGANPALICNYAGLSLEVAERVYLHFTEEDTKKVAEAVTYDVP